MKPRIGFCIFWALVGFFTAPFISNLLPGGGEEAQQWLDRVQAHIEYKLETCDPEMRPAFEQALKYKRVGLFGVRVMQLPDMINGYNAPWCPGITIDEEVPHLSLKYGAMIVVHEAMHNLPPYFGHTHIDDGQIRENL